MAKYYPDNKVRNKALFEVVYIHCYLMIMQFVSWDWHGMINAMIVLECRRINTLFYKVVTHIYSISLFPDCESC